MDVANIDNVMYEYTYKPSRIFVNTHSNNPNNINE